MGGRHHRLGLPRRSSAAEIDDGDIGAAGEPPAPRRPAGSASMDREPGSVDVPADAGDALERSPESPRDALRRSPVAPDVARRPLGPPAGAVSPGAVSVDRGTRAVRTTRDPGSIDHEVAGAHGSIETVLETSVVSADARSRRSVGPDVMSGHSIGTESSRVEPAVVTEVPATTRERSRPTTPASEPEPEFATRSDQPPQIERKADPNQTVVARVRPRDPRPASALPVTDRWTEPREPAAGRGAGPVIRVSIGRIEVRAITSSSPPRRVRTPPPSAAPSLEDYLRSRNGTRR